MRLTREGKLHENVAHSAGFWIKRSFKAYSKETAFQYCQCCYSAPSPINRVKVDRLLPTDVVEFETSRGQGSQGGSAFDLLPTTTRRIILR